jgi:hypothetical protein
VDVLIRSATVLMSCFLRGHLEGMLVSGQGSVWAWYQVGRQALMSGAIHNAARLVPYLFVVLIILRVLWFR